MSKSDIDRQVFDVIRQIEKFKVGIAKLSNSNFQCNDEEEPNFKELYHQQLSSMNGHILFLLNTLLLLISIRAPNTMQNCQKEYKRNQSGSKKKVISPRTINFDTE